MLYAAPRPQPPPAKTPTIHDNCLNQLQFQSKSQLHEGSLPIHSNVVNALYILLNVHRHGTRMRNARVGDVGNAEEENRSDFVSARQVQRLANTAHALEGTNGEAAPARAETVRLCQ